MTNWEFALSAADELVLWRLEAAVQDHQPDVVVFIAAALYDRASAAGLAGSAVIHVPLDDVLRTVRDHAASTLEAAPATAGLGAEQRERLLANFGSVAFASVQTLAGAVIARHVGGGAATLADRAKLMSAHRRAQSLKALERWAGDIY